MPIYSGLVSEYRRYGDETQRGAAPVVNSHNFRDDRAHRQPVAGFQATRHLIADFPAVQGADQTAARRPIYRHQPVTVDDQMKLVRRFKFAPISAPIILGWRWRFVWRPGRYGISFRQPRYPEITGPEALRPAVADGLPLSWNQAS